jgi:hypothetical protein
MVDRRAIWLVGREVWVCVHDLVTALLAVANDTGYTAKNSFALIAGALLVMAVQNLGVWREAAGRELWEHVSYEAGSDRAERRQNEMSPEKLI